MAFANTVTQTGDLLVLNGGYHPPIDLAKAIAGRQFDRLHIYGQPKNLQLLATLNHLVELRMQSTKLADFSLLAGMHRLEALTYGSGSLKECDVSFGAKSLTSLWLGRHRSLRDLSPITVCENLRELSLCDMPNLQGYVDLGRLRKLELLQLRNLRQWPSIKELAGAKSLEKLFLDKTSIEDQNWESLMKLKRLKFVSALEDAFGKDAADEFRQRRPEVESPRRFPP